jgi:hypothetical protein
MTKCHDSTATTTGGNAAKKTMIWLDRALQKKG